MLMNNQPADIDLILSSIAESLSNKPSTHLEYGSFRVKAAAGYDKTFNEREKWSGTAVVVKIMASENWRDVINVRSCGAFGAMLRVIEESEDYIVLGGWAPAHSGIFKRYKERGFGIAFKPNSDKQETDKIVQHIDMS